MSIEFRSIHACELCLVPNKHTTCSAHASSIHHDGVQADYRLYIEGFCHACHRTHHNRGTDSNDPVTFLPAFKDLLDDICHKAMVSFCPVVRGNEQFVTHLAHPVFPEKEVCTARSYNRY